MTVGTVPTAVARIALAALAWTVVPIAAGFLAQRRVAALPPRLGSVVLMIRDLVEDELTGRWATVLDEREKRP